MADATPYRWMRPMGLVALGIVATTAFQIHPAPGLHGQHLAVAVAVVALGAATVAMVRAPWTSLGVQVPLLGVIVLSAAALVGLQPDGPGFLGVFPAVAAAALRLPLVPGAAVAALGMAALAVAWGLRGQHTATGIILNEFGVVAFFGVATMARRLREANVQANGLIAELEGTRAAQAQAAALGERQRLAREMHDVLAHSLSGLVLNLEGARLIAARDGAGPDVADAIGRAHRLAKTGLEEARRAIGMLRDDALPGPDRLADLARQFEEDTGVTCRIAVDGDARELGSDARLTLYRVAQEALTNIRKHACAERVEISLAYEPGRAGLTVEDFERPDGHGPPGGGTGYGLTGMRERAELLGGTLTAGPTATGFRVEVWVPG
jgi:signal transduction histidine kinase